jgi:hypothetical protein
VSLRQKVRLELEDGTEVVAEYSAIDLRTWEKIHRKSALDESMSVSMLTWLGWNAAKRQGSINGQYANYDAFDAACTSVEGVNDEPEDEEDSPTAAVKRTATRKGRGPASSAPSP